MKEYSLMEAKRLLKAIAESKEKITLMMVGVPGIGKTQMVEQVAAEVGAKPYNIRTALVEPADLTGIPTSSGEYICKVLPPYNEKAIINFDEPNRGHISSIQAVFKIIEGRGSVGYKSNPELHTIVACANPISEADVIEILGEAFISRAHIIRVKAEVGEWVDYAKKRGIDEKIVQFLLTYPKFFCQVNNIKNVTEFNQVPNPRNWERGWLALKMHEEAGISSSVSNILSGSVGAEAAVAFESFLADPEPPVSAKDILSGKYLKDKKLQERYAKHQKEFKHKAIATAYDFAFEISGETFKDDVAKSIKKFLEDTVLEEVAISMFKKMVGQDKRKTFNAIIKVAPEFSAKHSEAMIQLNMEIQQLMGK